MGGGRRPPPQIIYLNHPPDGPHNSPADSLADSPQTASRQPTQTPFTKTPWQLLTVKVCTVRVGIWSGRVFSLCSGTLNWVALRCIALHGRNVFFWTNSQGALASWLGCAAMVFLSPGDAALQGALAGQPIASRGGTKSTKHSCSL